MTIGIMGLLLAIARIAASLSMKMAKPLQGVSGHRLIAKRAAAVLVTACVRENPYV